MSQALSSTKPRLWPGLLIVPVMVLAMILPAFLMERTMVHFISIFAVPVLALLAVLIWWIGLSRLSWGERLPALLVFFVGAVALGLTLYRADPMFLVYSLPIHVCLWVGVAILGFRRVGVPLAILAVWGLTAAIRPEGTDGNILPTLAWRWEKSAEERFLEQQPKLANLNQEERKLQAQESDWPEFRGPNRDAKRPGVRIATDWSANPPKELWRRLVGPGWSSICVVGDFLYTQYQRGEDEAVACFQVDTGEPVWEYLVPARFEEAIGGPGPRATPTFHNSQIFAYGAKGNLVCLDAATGKLIWKRDITADTGAVPPQWGFASSPLVHDGLVYVTSSGGAGKGVAAYDIASGELKWTGGNASHSYSSPGLVTIDSVVQVVLLSDVGLESIDPKDGKLLWHFDMTEPGLNRVVQPQLLNNNTLLVGTGVGSNQGVRQIKVTHTPDGKWQAEGGINSIGLRPYYNDFVIHKDHGYGFDGGIFGCIKIADGKRTWKGGRYGHGQVLLLPDQDLLVVLSETGDVVLLEANPEELVELGKIKALKDKTWNHPVLAKNKLFLRNGAEMVCYQLK